MTGKASWIGPGIADLDDINRIITAPVFAPRLSWRWWTAFLISAALTLLMIVTVTWLFSHGIGISATTPRWCGASP